ncbi:helicase domain protein [Desulfonatronospira thiodismutans ASO3-1]|uniref:Helicase domain protein n=1 Tax=Desulfonatronospira thiodismutans ASO3-1 TaxID=555779 RepID=D6SUV3_9BACT|nr:helicase-related protein [Desulfonatronospira thiodismutans]EFI33083.1 helicase domain protein [Desulfonatronospira thiodismutans ASO3-1]
MNQSITDTSSLWGQAFEIAVKRGVLAFLIKEELLSLSHQELSDWQNCRISSIKNSLLQELGIIDQTLQEHTEQALAHMFINGYGLGWSCIRQWLNTLKSSLKVRKKDKLTLDAIWCPLALPGKNRDSLTEHNDSFQQVGVNFLKCFNLDLTDNPGILAWKGGPARSDFTLMVTVNKKGSITHNLLVLEFSYFCPQATYDYSRENDHLEELSRYVGMMDKRGVFSRVTAELSQGKFDLSPTLSSHLAAFTSKDKPFYKLCQGASYVDTTLTLLKSQNIFKGPVNTKVMAVTSAGIESLSAEYLGETHDSRTMLMKQLGKTYRKTSIDKFSTQQQSDQALNKEIKMAFNQLLASLPADFKKQCKNLNELPIPGQSICYDFQEKLDRFYLPSTIVHSQEVEDLIGSDEKTDSYFIERTGKNAREIIGTEFSGLSTKGKSTLRDLHAAAVVSGLKAGKKGQVNVLALEGNPGIGKTTAVKNFLTDSDRQGYLFLYLSPRVVINKDVNAKFSSAGQDILTISTNAKLISNAASAYAHYYQVDGGESRINSVAIVRGVDDFTIPGSSTIWMAGPEMEDYIESYSGASRNRKTSLDERTDMVQEKPVPGVLRTIATSAGSLARENPGINRIVMTAALQSYKQTVKGSTIDSLSKIFVNDNPKSVPGKAERFKMAERFPNILVMLDEVAGDGSGSLFVHTITKWLERHFIDPFAGDTEGSPFTVHLIIADASLGNELIMESHLANESRAPEKVLISPSTGSYPFKPAVSSFKIGGRTRQVLHIMTNSYPATELSVRYLCKLHYIQPGERPDGTPMSIRERIRDQAEDLLLNSAKNEIMASVRKGAGQTIFFAQHKDFLTRIRDSLLEERSAEISDQLEFKPWEVAIIDSSVEPSKREQIIKPENRDKVRVFLMTSSGARGVSFPLATRIIAAIPRFNIESSLMELAQLIYRGRGHRTDSETGKVINCDEVPRELVMLIDDFLPIEDMKTDIRLWLRRSSDLLTLIIMLRGTIHTRITGDAGMSRKRFAIVPVGLIGLSELSTSMSKTVHDFITEGTTFKLREKTLTEEKKVVAAAVKNAVELFGGYDFQLNNPLNEQKSFSDMQEIKEFIRQAKSSTGKLIPGSSDSIPVLPDNIYCIGPFWLESWSKDDGKFMESQRFETFSADYTRKEKSFAGQLKHIGSNNRINTDLRRHAWDIYRLIARQNESIRLTYSSQKNIYSRHVWLSLPLNYPQFCRTVIDGSERAVNLKYPEEWKEALSRTMPHAGHYIPIIAEYETFPFAISLGSPDPARLDIIFDDRYFMASTELNLLNTLLLNDRE